MTLDLIVDRLHAPRSTGVLYHYTSLDGLIGILDAGAIWATDVRYVNDSEEQGYFVSCLRAEIDQRSKGATSEILEILTDIRSHIGRISGGVRSVFVASFSANGNLLSQWRSYCPPGSGVSIGFLADHLRECATKHGFSIGRCIYDLKEQDALVKEVLDRVVEHALASGKTLSVGATRESYAKAYLEVEEALFRIGALFKNTHFSEENEWRVVSAPVDLNRGTKISYRRGKSMLVPYVLLPLKGDKGYVRMAHVITGPTPNPQLSTSSVGRYIYKHMHGSSEVNWTDCGIPYRTW